MHSLLLKQHHLSGKGGIVATLLQKTSVTFILYILTSLYFVVAVTATSGHPTHELPEKIVHDPQLMEWMLLGCFALLCAVLTVCVGLIVAMWKRNTKDHDELKEEDKRQWDVIKEISDNNVATSMNLAILQQAHNDRSAAGCPALHKLEIALAEQRNPMSRDRATDKQDAYSGADDMPRGCGGD